MRSRIFLSLAAFILFVSTSRAQVSPDKAMETFKVSEGLEISLWASEPLFVNPTSMDIDHKGRVWVCESLNYRTKLRNQPPKRAEGDRIVVLEDTDADGQADKATTFYQAPDLLAPLSVLVAPDLDGKGCKVYVAHSPHIYLFEDKDGDLKADGKPKIFLTGFKGYDHDHGVHGLTFGPDGKLYFSVGDQGVQNLQSSDGKGRKWTSNGTDCRAGTIWRCDLDGKNLELIAHNFRNNYEPCIDSFGTIFVSDNDDDGNDQTRICYVMPGGNYGYHPRGKGQTHWHEEQPGVVPKILRTYRGSPTGMCMYEGTLLPKKYWGQPLHTDAGPGRLCCYHLKPKGAGYEVEREDMVTSKDSWFRPSDVCVAPDGSVFVADWYDPGVGGHGIGDFTRGRIYRVAPKGNKSNAPMVDLATTKAILDAWDSPNLSVRYLAMTQWQTTARPEIARAVVKAAENANVNPGLRARLFWYVHLVNPVGPHVVQKALRSADEQFRSLALRVLSSDYNGIRYEYHNVWTHFDKDERDALVADPSARVRSEAILALRMDDAEKVKGTVLELAKRYDGKDRFYLAAIGIAVGQPGISAEIDKRREIILADFDKHFPEWNDKVAGLVWELRPPGMVPMLEKRLADSKIPASQRGLIVDILAETAAPEVPTVLLKALSADPPPEVRDTILSYLKERLDGPWASLKKNPLLADITRQLLQNKKTHEAALALIGAGQQAEFVPQLMAHALESSEQAVRLAAVQALANFPDQQATQILALVIQQKKYDVGQEVRNEAVLALGKQGTAQAQQILRNLLQPNNDVPLPLQQAAVAGIASYKDGSGWLLDQYSKKGLSADLVSDLSRLLRNSPFPEVKKQAQKVLPAPPKLDPKKLPSIPALLARKGTIDRGHNVWLATLKNDAACMKCHTVSGQGGQVGPDLTTIGAKASRENLLDSILHPSKAITDQFAQWVVATDSGLVVNGLIVEETKDFIVVRDANAKDYKIAVKNIEKKGKAPTSLMPDNLLNFLSEDDLLDLVEYLYSLKGQGVPVLGRREDANPPGT